MTDLEKLKSLLTEFGVPFDTPGNNVSVWNHKSEKVTGYTCFYVEFEFDDAGKFIRVGIWE